MRRYKDRAERRIPHFKRRESKIAAAVIAAAVCAIVVLEIFVNSSLRPIASELAESYGSAAVVEIINNSVAEYFEGEDIGYSDLVRLRYNQSGFVTAVEYDSAAINRMKTSCLKKLRNDLAKLRAAKVRIPVGSLFGDLGTSGRGPRISVKFAESAVPDIEVLSTFESVGVNQSRHEIRLRVSAEVRAYLPPGSTGFTVSQDYVLAQTVIVGNVPDDNLFLNGSKA